MTSILILNGPNLNLLGTRQPDVYGKTTLADIETMCRDKAKSLGFGIAFKIIAACSPLAAWIRSISAPS